MKNNKEYSIVIVTCLPAFYKINLYNEINKKKKIFVVFTGKQANKRNKGFFSGEKDFDYLNLKKSNHWVFKIIEIYKALSNVKYQELIISGYDEPVLWFLAMFFPKKKNAAVVESSFLESKATGLKGFVKSLFFKRISKVYASGRSQEKLVRNLKYKGKVIITKGVGIFNLVEQPSFIKRETVTNFLYVGRLSEEKNLEILIKTFNELPQLKLNIVGFGPQEEELKVMAKENVFFHGAIDNKELSKFYQSNDVFILPSKSEPWGLVVEEALNNGLPVVLSDRIGCREEIINDSNGLVFKYDDIESLRSALNKIKQIDFYNKLRLNISKTDFKKISDEQVSCYC